MRDFSLDNDSNSDSDSSDSNQDFRQREKPKLDDLSNDSSLNLNIEDGDDNSSDSSLQDRQQPKGSSQNPQSYKQPQNKQHLSRSSSQEIQPAPNHNRLQPQLRNMIQPQQNVIEQRSKRGVNIFQRKRKEILQEVIVHKKIDFGESGEVGKKVIDERRLELESQKSIKITSPQSIQEQKKAPKVNLFDIMGKNENAQKNKIDQQEKQRMQMLDLPVSNGISRINSTNEIKGILKNVQSQSSQANSSLKGFALGHNADQHGQKVDSKNSSIQNNSLESSCVNELACAQKSIKSNETKKTVQIEEKNTIPQSYMNVLNKDDGFQNVRNDYPTTDTEILANFYIKNDFNVQNTIKDLYSKLKLLPTDKDNSSHSSDKDSSFKTDQDEDLENSSEEDDELSSQQRKQVSRQESIISNGLAIKTNMTNTIRQQQAYDEKMRSQAMSQKQDSQRDSLIYKQHSNASSKDYGMSQLKLKEYNQKIQRQESLASSRKVQSQNSSNNRSSKSSRKSQRQNDYEMDDSSSDEEEIKKQSFSGNSSIHISNKNSENFGRQNDNNAKQQKTNSVFDKINSIKQMTIPTSTNFNGNLEIHKQQEYNQNLQKSITLILEKDPWSGKGKKDKVDLKEQQESLPKKDISKIDGINKQSILKKVDTTEKHKNLPESVEKEETTSSCCSMWNKSKQQTKNTINNNSEQNQKRLVHEKVSFLRRFI